MKLTFKGVAYSGILYLILMIVYLFLLFSGGGEDSLLIFFIQIIGFATLLLSMIILFGYLKLSNLYKADLLKVMTIIGIIFSILFLVLSLSGILFEGVLQVNAQEMGVEGDNGFIETNPYDEDMAMYEELSEESILFFFGVFFVFVFFSMIYGAYFVLFGFGLLKLKKEIKYAKETGLCYIIAGFTFIILIGFFILIIAQILEIMMFFKASELLDKKNGDCPFFGLNRPPYTYIK
jgi:hypothetical protein